MAPQMQITFRLLDAADLEFYRSWFNDAELARRLSYPTDDWFAYVTATEASRCWVGLDETGGVISVLQVDDGENGLGQFDISLRPELRGRGLGAAVLDAFIGGPGADFTALEGAIEPDNAASLACVRRCGFEIYPGLDEDGLVRVRRDREEVDL